MEAMQPAQEDEVMTHMGALAAARRAEAEAEAAEQKLLVSQQQKKRLSPMVKISQNDTGVWRFASVYAQ